ncbi:MAG TPA: hypothetical protein GX708_15465 [Gallicola sp.]|nr:hypothetical protein [Gallicola sp.]
MNTILKGICEIIGDFAGSFIKVNVIPKHRIYFEIYETEVPILIDIKTKGVSIECETFHGGLTGDMLEELSKIVRLLEENVDELIDIVDIKES